MLSFKVWKNCTCTKCGETFTGEGRHLPLVCYACSAQKPSPRLLHYIENPRDFVSIPKTKSTISPVEYKERVKASRIRLANALRAPIHKLHTGDPQ